jgi:hypothetical protein
MTGIYHKYNIAGRLRTTVLGSFFGPEYFEFINDVDIRDPLQKVAAEINQDLNFFQQILESHGSVVLKPHLMSVREFKDFFDSYGYFPRAPLQPRNHHAIIGDRCYRFTVDSSSIVQCLELYNNNIVDLTQANSQLFVRSMEQNLSNYNPTTNTWYRRQKYHSLAGPDWPKFENYIKGDRSTIPFIQQELEEFQSEFTYENKELTPAEGPNFMVLGNRLVIDCNEYCDYAAWSQEHIPGFETYSTINTTAGHTDGCFVIVGNKTIIGIEPLIDYHTHFPDYKIVRVPPKNYQDILHTYQHSQSNKMRAWFISGEDRNKPLQEYIDKYFEKYTGFSPETVFDVNVLALDQTNVCVTADTAEVISPLQQQGINCIHVPWRHRWFVDCGLHCITLDLHRDD